MPLRPSAFTRAPPASTSDPVLRVHGGGRWGWVEVPGAVGCAVEGPAAFMDEVVVVVAAGAHAVEVGVAAVFPGVDVVDLAVSERHVAVGVHAAGRIAGPQRHPLRPGRQAAFSAHIEGLAVAVEDDGDDPGVAGHAADGFDR